MNHLYTSIAICLLSVTSMATFAKEMPMNMQQGQTAEQGMQKGMTMMDMSEEMKDKMARDQQDYILKVDALSDQISEEKNATKKQALMDEQLQLIKEHQEKKRLMKKKRCKNICK